MIALPDRFDQLDSLLIYGPPRSRRGRLLNRLRKLVGLDPQYEVYAYYDGGGILPRADKTGVVLRWSDDGTLTEVPPVEQPIADIEPWDPDEEKARADAAEALRWAANDEWENPDEYE